MALMRVHDALSVPETLESISLNLPLRRIIRLRAVCREFQRMIDETTTIQRALFQKPSSTECLEWFRGRSSDPLYNRYPDIPPNLAPKGWKDDGLEKNPSRVPILNPFVPTTLAANEDLFNRQWYAPNPEGIFLNRSEVVAYGGSFRRNHSFSLRFPNGMQQDERRRINQALKRSQGVFKNMQLTHPPIKELCLTSFHDLERRVGGAPVGITIERLIRDCIGDHDQMDSRNLVTDSQERLEILAKTVDEIIGFEMLYILDSDLDELEKELFLEQSVWHGIESEFCKTG